jgi:type IX secretion system PorP/SprF family membrane protein
MKKVLISVILSLLCIGSAFSQFDAQFSQYMFNQTAFNPAAVGESGMIQATGQYRLQWLGIPNAGKTLVFGLNSPLKIGSNIQGVGVRFMKDEVGGFVNQTVHFQFAYKKNIGVGRLSVGADIGLASLGFKGDSVTAHKITLGDYHDLTSDPEIPQTSVSGTGLDMNVGVFYSTPVYYLGASFSHLNSPVISWNDKSNIKLKGSMFLTGGYNYQIPNSKYVFKPSGLFKTDLTTFQLDLSTRVEYDNKYWGGIAYRFQDAISILAGLNISSGLSIGYSYDFPTSKILMASSGSHEIIMIYSFEYVFGKRNSKYKSIRIL